MLVLYWHGKDDPSNVAVDRHLQAAFKRDPAETVEYYAEYFESDRFPGEAQARILRDYLRQKYASRKIHVLLAVSPVPLEFLLMYRNDLFPGTPIVFYTAADLEPVNQTAGPAFTGVSTPDAYGKTLDAAVRLHPEVRQAFIISGTPDRDRMIERQARKQLEGYQSRIALTYITDLPLDELIATVKNVPERSIILYPRQSQEDPGRVLSPIDFLTLISRSAPVPVYSPGSAYVGYGSVGGYVIDLEAGATTAAEIALRVAQGTRPEDIPVAQSPTIPMFDGRQLTRWGISEDRLPPDSVILFRDPTVWDQYKSYIIGTVLLLAVKTAMIGGLLVQRARRRRTEALLKQSEQRYELATAAGRVGVWDWNLETNQIYVDPALKRALGFADHEIDNHLDSWGKRVHPEDISRVLMEAQAHIDGRTPCYECEHRMLHRDGSVRWFLARGSAERLPDGRVVRIIGTDTDITERKSAEAGLEETRHELARVARVTTLAEFAASIAHEVSQPLTAILMNVKACLRWLESPAPPSDDLHAALLDIADAANRANDVMSRNRTLFRHHTVEKQFLNINSVVRDVAALARTRLQQSQVTLETTLDEDLPAVFGDRVELQQVLLNLLLNAIEAMEAVHPRSRRLQIDSRLTGEGLVQITVRDTGIGLGEVDFERMFTAFYTTKPAGTGVGLSISRFIVEAHGGLLWADRSDGPGATFCFTIAVASEETIEPVGEEGTGGDRGQSVHRVSRH